MAELRRDPVSGRWVIIATERAARPHDFFMTRGRRRGGFCPFCEGNEDRTPPEIAAVRPLGGPPDTPGWKVRVVPNKFPALRMDQRLEVHDEGAYHTVEGFGIHEVIIESSQHLVSPTEMATQDFGLVLQTYCDRSRVLSADERLAYVLVFKNVGQTAGASIEHSHSQLIGVPVMPKRVHEEMRSCEEFFEDGAHCLFCSIIEQELADGRRVVAESDGFVVLCPFAARFPFEMWLLPKEHMCHLFELDGPQLSDAAGILQEALARLEVCLQDPPYNYAIHTAPTTGEGASYYHWHVELIPRVTQVAGFEWGTGFYINPMAPESAAQYLREVPQRTVRDKVAAA
ncbi:MAG: galactose-1-phosphate uridylyltransferase, partial [Planctomycetota bacterium]